MFQWLKDALAFRQASKVLLSSEILQVGMLKSSTTFDSLPLKDSISEETKLSLSRSLLESLAMIEDAQDQVAACRELLCNAVISYANYQVIVMAPPPEEDPTGLRDQPGITGELKERRVELAEKNESLKEELYGAVSEVTENTVWDWCLLNYWRWWWWMHTFNAVRVHLKDYNEANEDWFQPFIHSQCAFAEDVYRRDLGMPSALNPERIGITGVMFSTFMNFVTDGSRYPDLAWREHWADSIADGTLTLPDFGSKSDA